MMEIREVHKNLVLEALSREDRELLEPALVPVPLEFRKRLQMENRKIEAVYFPDSGIASVVAIGRGERRQSEVALIGREGMTGFAVALGVDRAPFDVFMQVEGNGMAITTDDLRAAMERSPSLRGTLQKAVYVFCVQTACTTLANSQGQIEERLARWLLMAHDRTGTSEMLLTHEFLSLMLGVRRAGVTIALQHLSSRGLIETGRGVIILRDRDGLEESAGGLYGTPEVEFQRLFG